MGAAVGEGGHIATNWECAGVANVHEGGFEVGDGDGFGTVPVDEAVLDGESDGDSQ